MYVDLFKCFLVLVAVVFECLFRLSMLMVEYICHAVRVLFAFVLVCQEL